MKKTVWKKHFESKVTWWKNVIDVPDNFNELDWEQKQELWESNLNDNEDDLITREKWTDDDTTYFIDDETDN